jgi:DNA-binding CsgD family transcriptional regulator
VPLERHNDRMSQPGPLPQSGISAREAEVLAALGEHLSNAEIGARLFISVRTVESHVSSLLRKLRASDRRELADMAARMGQGGATDGAAASVTVDHLRRPRRGAPCASRRPAGASACHRRGTGRGW